MVSVVLASAVMAVWMLADCGHLGRHHSLMTTYFHHQTSDIFSFWQQPRAWCMLWQLLSWFLHISEVFLVVWAGCGEGIHRVSRSGAVAYHHNVGGRYCCCLFSCCGGGRREVGCGRWCRWSFADEGQLFYSTMRLRPAPSSSHALLVELQEVGGDIAGGWWWPTICWGNGSQVVVLLAPTGAVAPPPPPFHPNLQWRLKRGGGGGWGLLANRKSWVGVRSWRSLAENGAWVLCKASKLSRSLFLCMDTGQHIVLI